MDEHLNDSVWAFVHSEPLVLAENGLPTKTNTSFRMCWDEKFLYIAFECQDSDIVATYKEHDSPVFLEDAVEVFLDPDCDLTSYFEIDLSPANVVFDAQVDPSKGLDISSNLPRKWNCEGLHTSVAIIDSGWTAVMAIPFSGLAVEIPHIGSMWRANIFRVDFSHGVTEYQAWSPTMVTPAFFHLPDCFGSILFSGEADS